MYIITGQTGTGKTSYAQDLAAKYGGEIINSDSRQVYKRLDVITGKDLPHGSTYTHLHTQNSYDIGYYDIKLQHNNYDTKLWLYDIVDPHNYFSSYDYTLAAANVIDNLKQQNKTPIFVGGTYLYIKHLLYGVSTESIPPNHRLREELNNMPVEKLQHKLHTLSSLSLARLNHSDRHNPRRLIRHIEIALASKQDLDNKVIDSKRIDLADVTIVGFRFSSKDTLIKRIQQRVHERIQQGGIEEVEKLLHLGYNEEDPGLKTIGYLSILKYLHNQLTKEEAINEWIIKEIQYAKRQLTFMKTDPHIQWEEIQ